MALKVKLWNKYRLIIFFFDRFFVRDMAAAAQTWSSIMNFSFGMGKVPID